MDIDRESCRGPFVAGQLREGDRYELHNGHPVYCAPAGREHAGRHLVGSRALASDPDVTWSGVDAGFTPEPGTLRAPDVAVGAVAAPPDGHGWIDGVPPLAVEYAGRGQDEVDLREKIADLLHHGTLWVWVVRLTGPRRVEVHETGQAVRVLLPGDELRAPGVLRNPVPVEALYDPRAADALTLRNLLQREGYPSLEAVLDEGREEGRRQEALALLWRLSQRRFGPLSDEVQARLATCALDELESLLERLMDARAPEDWMSLIRG